MEDLGIGIIGAGKIAQRHLAAYRAIGCGHLLLTDIDPEKAAAAKQEWNIRLIDDVDRLLSSSDLEAVDICTPNAFHAPYALAALRAGKHVFCEKPLSMTVGEANEIRAAAEQAGKTVMVGFLYRFFPAFQFLKRLLEEHVIGDPYLALMRIGGRGDAAAWKHDWEEGGGAVSEMMVHMLDLALWLFGPVNEVKPLWQEIVLPEREIRGEAVPATAEDLSLVRLHCGDGVEVLCESDLVTPSYMQHIDIQGSNGSIFASLLHYLPTVVYCKEQRGIYDQGHNIYTFPQVNVFEQELRYFLQSINGSVEGGEDALESSIQVVELMDQVRRQAPNAASAHSPTASTGR